MIKILKKGIRADGKYIPCFYSAGALRNHPAGSVTIYAKNFDNLPKELNPEDKTDLNMDYFDRGRAVVHPDNVFYQEVLKYVK
jgi:hypothetical protein